MIHVLHDHDYNAELPFHDLSPEQKLALVSNGNCPANSHLGNCQIHGLGPYRKGSCLACRAEKQNALRADQKQRAIEYLGGKCENCGYDRCPAALDFHHRDQSQKTANVGQLMLGSWESLVAELDKCDLLCSNCHREHHARPKGLDSLIPETLVP